MLKPLLEGWKAQQDEANKGQILAANRGGSFVDAGVGLTLHALSGPFKGDRLSVEWLRPIYTDANGYQLRPGTTVSAKASIAL